MIFHLEMRKGINGVSRPVKGIRKGNKPNTRQD